MPTPLTRYIRNSVCQRLDTLDEHLKQKYGKWYEELCPEAKIKLVLMFFNAEKSYLQTRNLMLGIVSSIASAAALIIALLK